jgi:hypothetical protein
MSAWIKSLGLPEVAANLLVFGLVLLLAFAMLTKQ